MKAALLLLLCLSVAARATTVVFRYGINPELPPNTEDTSYAPDENATVQRVIFRRTEGPIYQDVTNCPNGFTFTVPDGQELTVALVGNDGSIFHEENLTVSGRWIMWSVPSSMSRDHLTAVERTDASSRITLGLCCLGLGAIFFRSYKTGRSGT